MNLDDQQSHETNENKICLTNNNYCMKTKKEFLNECFTNIKKQSINVVASLACKYGKFESIPEYAILVEFIRTVVQNFEKLEHPIRSHGSCIYIFNGIFWEQFTKKERRALLPTSGRKIVITCHTKHKAACY